MLDLTEQDFQDISNVTGRIFGIGVQHSDDFVSMSGHVLSVL
jgi:hypothetical protein